MATKTTTFLRNIAVLATFILMISPSAVNAGIEDPEVNLLNWHEVTAGKRILINYDDPYEEFSQAFAPIWRKLEKKYRDDPDIKMIEINCSTEDGLQLCIDHDTEHNPELHYGDAAVRFKYIGSGNYEPLVDFIERNLRKPFCSVVTPEACPEEEQEGIKEIDRLTVDYLNNLRKILPGWGPAGIAGQSIKKFGIKNPFVNDFDDVITEEDYSFPELMFDGRPSNEDVYAGRVPNDFD